MGADMILAYMPKFKMTDERKKQGIAAIANATEEQLKNCCDFELYDNKEEFAEKLAAIFEEVEHLYGRRDVAEIQPPGCPYPLLISGGPSWGDEPTEACRTISLVTDFDPLYDLFVQWAGEDNLHGYPDKDGLEFVLNASAEVDDDGPPVTTAIYTVLLAMNETDSGLTNEEHIKELSEEIQRVMDDARFTEDIRYNAVTFNVIRRQQIAIHPMPGEYNKAEFPVETPPIISSLYRSSTMTQSYQPGTKSYVLNNLHCAIQEMMSHKISFDEAIQTQGYSNLEEVLGAIEAVRDTEATHYARVGWDAGDVQTLFEVTDDKAEEFLQEYERKIQDRIIELGWGVIETFGVMHGLEKLEE